MTQWRVRGYEGGDETAIVDLWNRSLPEDPTDLRTFTAKVLCDANFDPAGCLVAEFEGRLVGFLLALVRRLPMKGADLEPEQGWITVFGVHPDWRGQGIGGALMQAAEEFFRERGRRFVSFSPYAPNYFLPGLDADAYPAGLAFLQRHGFRTLYTPVAMDRSLIRFSYPDDVRRVEEARRAEGYRFPTLEHRYLTEVIRFAVEHFSADWSRTIREGVARGIPFEQFFLAVDPQDRVVGFAMHGAYDGILERFGPFGVDESQRGKGLGKVLLALCMEAMHRRGLHNVWFLWTGETNPAGHLYLRSGFQITRRFHVMRKELA